MNPKKRLAGNLAAALAAGAWNREAVERRAAALLGPRAPKSRAKLIDHIFRETVTPYAPPPGRLAELILAASVFDRVARSARARGTDPVLVPPEAAALPPLAGLAVPRLGSELDLADWLGISLTDLDWFADARRQHRHTAETALQHYAYAWVPKRSGAARLIEAPKSRLKEIQRQILGDILDHLPAHDAAHGFVKGRSCRGAAARHGGEAVVVTVDLKDFFLNVPPRRVHGLFRSLGYPWAVARALTGLCTAATPAGVFDALPAPVGGEMRRRYGDPHLPQGAPTSPALANLAAWRLDCRLAGLARRFEANYTRYADDLAFSGDAKFAGRLGRFLGPLREIVGDAGFALNPAKTRIMRQSSRQRVTGLVVNRHINIARADFDRLKATLHNCARRGPDGQNRGDHGDFRAHLDGRVTWVETVNPHRGRRLREIFEAIDWPARAG